MKTFKLTFVNTSGKIDFVLIDAISYREAQLIGDSEMGKDKAFSLIDVTDRFVDADGTITNTYFKRIY
jgi:hypothetical protein